MNLNEFMQSALKELSNNPELMSGLLRNQASVLDIFSKITPEEKAKIQEALVKILGKERTDTLIGLENDKEAALKNVFSE